MDEFSKTMIAAAIGGGLTILGGIISKAFEFWLSTLKEKREFKKHRREKAYAELEDLKDRVGKIYELSANWKPHEVKREDYLKAFDQDHDLIGRYNKYPEIAIAARDTLQWCKIVSSDEQSHDKHGALIENKKELLEKYRTFIQICDRYIESLL